MSSHIKMAEMPTNYRTNIEWIMNAYSDAGVTFPNGFQKDTIQNATGARKYSKWTGWKCHIYIEETPKGKFLIVEDEGTTGLTGRNLSITEINQAMEEAGKKDAFPKDERIARISSRNNSGGNDGAGLYGVGKSVYAAASKDYTYIFDSLRDDGLYVANINERGKLFEKALEGKEAKAFITERTGVHPKITVGTRIIVFNPNDELVDSIISGKMIPYIQESWWRIIQCLDKKSGIYVNGVKVTVPEYFSEAVHKYEQDSVEKVYEGHKVKHFGIYIFENPPELWNEFSYYRKGMKIGPVSLKDIPSNLKGKIWGYIEVEPEWEAELGEIEDGVHFGISKGKAGRKTYIRLRQYVQQKVNSKLIEWGYIKDKEYTNNKLRDEMQELAEEIQDSFAKLGFTDIGSGPKKPSYDVRWQDVNYPNSESEVVADGDHIKFAMRVTSSYTITKEFTYSLKVINADSQEVVSEISRDSFSVDPDGIYKKTFDFKVTSNNAVRFKENHIVLCVQVKNGGKERRKELPFFYDIDKPMNKKSIVNLSMNQCKMPTEGSRRVNFGESIKDIVYRIDNNRMNTLSYQLNISVHNADSAGCEKIVDVRSLRGVIAPYEGGLTDTIDEIRFDESVYKTYLEKGRLELRARLITAESDGEYEKGQKITHYHYSVFLNCDEKNGRYDAFEVSSVDDPDKPLRAWFESSPKRTIYVNVGHPSYYKVQDYPELQRDYLKEQMMTQFVLMYLDEGLYEVFQTGSNNFTQESPQTIVGDVFTKIESVIYNSNQ